MQSYPEIKRFVRETLGCTCPEAVLDRIDYSNEIEGLPGRKVTVGDRLLIYIISMDGVADIQGAIRPALERGVEERNGRGLNRFRLVLVCSSPDELRSLSEQAFDNSGYVDEKTHLHVVSERDVAGF